VIHLNGLAGDDPRALTFSTLQYASRLCGGDRHYEQLVPDLEHAAFVFAGTTLDEMTLWQHLELRRRANGEHARPASVLIARRLPRARRALLERHNIRWIEASIAEVAATLTRSCRSRAAGRERADLHRRAAR
jgi:hypothetical protein